MPEPSFTYNFHELKIDKPMITLMASGLSICDIPLDQLNYHKRHSYFISTNYPLALKFPGFSPDAHVWSDHKTTEFMKTWEETHPKDCVWISRNLAFNRAMESYKIKGMVDHWYNNTYYNLTSNFTVFWIVQLLRRYHPTKPIALFGLDGYIPELPPVDGVVMSKWYDYYIKHDSSGRNHLHYSNALTRFVKDMEKDCEDNPLVWDLVFNCNLDSKVGNIQKKSFEEVLSLVNF